MIRSSIPFLFLTISGSWLLWASLPLYFGERTVTKCVLTTWFQLTGYCVIIAALISKMALTYTLILSGKKVKRGFSGFHFLMKPFLSLFAVEIVLLILWSVMTSHFVVTPTILYDEFVTYCESSKTKGVISILLWVYNVLLLVVGIILVLITRDAENYTGETTYSATIVATFAVIGLVVIPVILSTSHPTSSFIDLQILSTALLICITLGSLMIPKIYIIINEERKIEQGLRSFFKAVSTNQEVSSLWAQAI
ncbi:hypothetical protein BCR33DRAFT_534882 [Rhizoclosmatium globosum]|uniref:G-protein coupled receptors family 3 profile domain-containing protein n=1 Tax=Rhizoclosmatium globosum TaxID=329046 RepID=A0A1Y2BCC5_9FUNG|nr:hypothetical protein BCR33DRAFT_534882 [Rhizoclosmatium globosum]|eukprot:ORY32414.1 hypothetical protein BCR33DRAFT_534882 [Rhizoclosmatium globosum]